MKRCTCVLMAVVAGLATTGCFRVNNQAAGTGPANPKVNPAGPFPVVQRTIAEADLKQLGLFYQNAALAGQPPHSLDELDIKLQAPKLYQAIADKRIIVYWNANPNNAPAGTSQTVLAYDADVATKRSAVLMLDGTVTVMDPTEFQKAPKAGQ